MARNIFGGWVLFVVAMLGVAVPASAQTVDEVREQIRQTRAQIDEAEQNGMDASFIAMLRENLDIAEAALRDVEADETAAAAAASAPAPDPVPEPLPAEVGAALTHQVAIPLDRVPATWATTSYRFFVCNGETVWLSFSPQLPQGLSAVDLRGSVFPGGKSFAYPGAKPVGALGCDSQGVAIGSLSEFKDRFVQHSYTNGEAVWDYKTVVEHFLGTLSINP